MASQITREVLAKAKRLQSGTYVILSGANLGRPKDQLNLAANRLQLAVNSEIIKSSLWVSPPWGFESENDFFNQLLVFSSPVLPLAMLTLLKSIELEMGRNKINNRGYESRIIDLDILFYGNEVFESPKLNIPHPLIPQRKFATAPLNELLPNFIHPVLNKEIGLINEVLTDKVYPYIE